jgi:hypothetical protein
MLVAIARIPDGDQARARAAQAAGLALADLNRRLAGILPRVLFAGGAPAGLVETLEGLGFGVLTCDPAAVPDDDQRVAVRRIELGAGALVASDSRGEAHRCGPGHIALLQRGIRVSKTTQTVKTSERKLDVGRAVLSGGLMLTKKVEKTDVKTTETSEPFLLVQRRGERDLILYERRIDYRALGAEMQPASRGNLEVVWRKLVGMAPDRVDDRVARPGFVAGLPATSANAVDLALTLVALDRGVGVVRSG